MTGLSGANHGVTEVRGGFRFDEARLLAWLDANVPAFVGPMILRRFRGGQSNPTYLIHTPRCQYVLRRKPAGVLLKGAHAIEREARVLSRLGAVGFPVPRVHALCTDDAIIGTWFYVMEMVEGRIFWDAALPDMVPAARAACFDSMNATLAKLHTVDVKAAGLEDYGPRGNYFERQIRRWSGQYHQDEAAGRSADMDRLINWLGTHIPATDESTIVHGDFRVDNVIFHPAEPRVLAVLDWELSTTGHPMADFAYHAMMYRMPPHIVAGLVGVQLQTLGIPTEQEYLAAYCHRTERAAVADYEYCLVFNFFRLAAIFHGIKGRVLRGNAASADATARAESFSELANIGWRIVEGSA